MASDRGVNEFSDVAIIGGGISALYLAHRLAECKRANVPGVQSWSPRSSKIRVFEATSRPGGRLLSARLPCSPFVAELGGMRYTSSHLLFRGLVRALTLGDDEVDFRFRDQGMYLRGRRLLANDVHDSTNCTACGNPTTLPYLLQGRGQATAIDCVKAGIRDILADVEFDDPGTPYLRRACREVGRRIQSLDPDSLNRRMFGFREWDLIKRYALVEDRPLHTLGFWNALQHYLDSEAFLYAHDGLGYESILTNWNAAEAIPWFLGDFGVNYSTLVGGLSRVAMNLAQRILERDEDAIQTEAKVRSLEITTYDGERWLRIDFENRTSVLSRCVVLAIPKGALARIRLFSDEHERPPSWSRFEADRESVTAHPLFKLFLGYEAPWWRKDQEGALLGFDCARITTDLPIRQIYYLSSRCQTPPSDAPGEEDQRVRGMIMASYSDEHYVDFWRPLQRERSAEPYCKFMDAVTNPRELNDLLAYGVTKPMILKAHRQVRQLHDLQPEGSDVTSSPLVGLGWDWSRAPFYGGWHSWNPHARSWEVMDRMTQPFPELPVFTCGEAYSTEQGWVEGALKSAERVLSAWNVPPPKWLRPSDCYELGGNRARTAYIHS